MRGWPTVVRRARAADKEAVLRFATHTWHGWDYIPDVWDSWLVASDSILLIATPGQSQDGSPALDAEGRELASDLPIAMTRVVMLTGDEAWFEGVRVDPRVRGLGVATDLQVAELRWAAAHGARRVRYMTGADNHGSHRLGAKHGLRVVTAYRWYGWDEDRDGAVPPASSAGAPSIEGTVLPTDAPVDGWWAKVLDDPTFQACGQLFEIRSWAFSELTPELFAERLRSGMVHVWPPGSDVASPSAVPWALYLLRGEPEGEDAPDQPVSPSLVVGHAAPALELARALGGGRAGLPRIRLPDPDPPLLTGGAAEAWAQAGWPAIDRTTHLLARDLDPAERIPAADGPDPLEFDLAQVGDGKR